MHSLPRPARTPGWLLLLTGSLLGTGLGCTSRTDAAEETPSFRAIPITASAEKGELEPVLLRARVVTPEPGIEPALVEQAAETANRGGPQSLHLIAQLGGLPSEEQWKELQAQGIHRAAFLHGRSFIVRVELAEGAGEERLAQVREALGALALLRYAPEDRVPPALLEGKFEGEKGQVRVRVLLFPETPEETVERIIKLAHRGAEAPERPDGDSLLLETDAEGIGELMREDAVHDVGEEVAPLPLMHRVRESTGAEGLQGFDPSTSPPTYHGLSGAGVSISLGLESPDTTHDDFWNHDAQGARTTPRAVACGNLDAFHGSHVGGIAMGNGFLSGGRYRGMAPEATSVCYGSTRSDVSNHSYTGDPDGFYLGGEAARDGYMNNPASPKYHLHVQAVANQGITAQYGNTAGYYSVLATRKNAVTVANIDSVDLRWAGSSMGPTLDGRLKPDMAAPGSLTRFPEKSQVLFELDFVTLASNGTPVHTWGFDTQGQHQGWGALPSWEYEGCIGARSWTPAPGGLALAIPLLPQCKPWIATATAPTGAALSVAGNASHTVTIRYRFEPTPMWSEEKALLWWARHPTSGPYFFTDFPIQPDGQWHTATVNVGQHASWVGTNQLLRISPVAHAERAIISTGLNNTYCGSGGSSMAAPAVTGATALLLQQMVAQHGVVLSQQGVPSPFWLPSPGQGAPMPSTLKAILVHSARDLASLPRFHESFIADTSYSSPVRYHKGPDFATGYGALDVAEALRLVQAGRIVENELGGMVQHGYSVTVPSGSTVQRQPLKVTLAWSDPAGSTVTGQTVSKLVNDLDLLLISPTGQFHFPWSVPQPYVPSSPSQNPDVIEPEPISASNIVPAGRGTDRRNNLEQVYVENPEAGLWTVSINPAALPLPPQRYSLVLGTPSKPATHLDGGKVAWTSNRTTPMQLFARANTPGAPVQQLTSGPNDALNPAWSPSGDFLAYVTDEQPVGGVLGGSLVILNASGGVAAQWHRPLNTRYVTHPSWSWDGRHITFGAYDAWGCQGLAVVDFANPYEFSTASMRMLVPASCAPAHLDPTEPEFSHDGAFIYFGSTTDHPNGPGGLYRIASSGVGAIEPVFADGVPSRRAYSVSLSSDGKRAAYNSELYRDDPVRNWDEEAFTLDLTTGVSTQLTFEAGHQYAYYPVGGDDGELLLHSSTTAGGNFNFFLVEHGVRRPFDMGDPSNAFNDKYPTWWKRAPRCVAAPSGLRAWYPLDESQGTQFVDLVAGGSPGTASGALPALGMVRQARAFDGVDDSALIPDQPRLDLGTGDLTLAAWVRMPSAGATSRVLLDKRQASPLRGYTLVVIQGCLVLQLAEGSGGSGYVNYSSGVCVTDGAWHHVAVTVTRNSTTGIQFYRDGLPSSVFSSMGRGGSLDNTSGLFLGQNAISPGSDFTNGRMDEVMLFGRALSGAEVQAMVAAGPSGLCR